MLTIQNRTRHDYQLPGQPAIRPTALTQTLEAVVLFSLLLLPILGQLVGSNSLRKSFYGTKEVAGFDLSVALWS